MSDINTSDPFALLSLPEELIIYVLTFVDFPVGIVACLVINRRLAEVIAKSALLQYIICLRRYGAQDNYLLHNELSLVDRCRMLKSREDSWMRFKPSAIRRVKLPEMPSGIYDLTGAHYLFGQTNRKGMRLLRLPRVGLPDSDTDGQWSRISHNVPMIDIGLALNEHDLCAIIDLEVKRHGATTMDIAHHVVLVQASTRSPHPDAKQASIPLVQYEANLRQYIPPSVFLEIVGRFLILLMTETPLTTRPTIDRIWIIDWKEGVVLKHYTTSGPCYHGLVVLSESLALFPNERDNTLEIWDLPTSMTKEDAEQSCSISPRVTLGLPQLKDDFTILNILCRCEPNPMSRVHPDSLASQLPFHTSPESALILFTFHIQAPDGTRYKSALFVHRDAISRAFDEHTTASGETVPWNSWGPPVTRYIDSAEFSTRWITSTCGQRAVVIAADAREREARIEILDFNPHNFNDYRDRFRALLDRHRDALVRDDEGMLYFSYPMDVSVIQFALDPEEVMGKVFKEPVWSELPYVKVDSGGLEQGRYNYDGVLMDEENLIGILTDSQHRISSLDIMHFA